MSLLADKTKDEKDEALKVEEPDHAAPLRADVLGSIAGADPNSSGYLGKINHLITAHGALEKLNPFAGHGLDLSGMTSDSEQGPSKLPQLEAPSTFMTPIPSAPAAGSDQELHRMQADSPVMAPAQPHRGWLGKIGHGLARMGNIAGDILAPGIMAITPGTDLNKRIEAARSEDRKRLTDTAASEEGLRAAQADEARARAESLRHPPQKEGLTPEETTIHDLMTGENGQPRINPDTQKPYSYLEAFKAVNDAKQAAKPEKANDFDKFYSDWLKDHNYPDTSHNRLVARKEYAAAGQPPQRDPRQLAVAPDGTVIELKPGVKVPTGTKTVAGDLKGPTADEQKRADLAQNLNENLDQLEEIVNRRPDLFGKVQGRFTKFKEWAGSDDPDVAALKGIEDRLGMVAQSSHGMRSAQHVAESANSILNSYKNGPDAMKRAIADARKSAQTFLDNAGAPAQPQHPGTEGGGDMIDVQIPGHKPGRIPASQKDQFLKDNPKAKVL